MRSCILLLFSISALAMHANLDKNQNANYAAISNSIKALVVDVWETPPPVWTIASDSSYIIDEVAGELDTLGVNYSYPPDTLADEQWHLVANQTQVTALYLPGMPVVIDTLALDSLYSGFFYEERLQWWVAVYLQEMGINIYRETEYNALFRGAD